VHSNLAIIASLRKRNRTYLDGVLDLLLEIMGYV